MKLAPAQPTLDTRYSQTQDSQVFHDAYHNYRAQTGPQKQEPERGRLHY